MPSPTEAVAGNGPSSLLQDTVGRGVPSGGITCKDYVINTSIL